MVLLDLAWSLWTELGVAGVKQMHQEYLVAPEELILLTAVMGEIDPRLREEALDWCSRYHQYISVSRLKTLAKSLGNLVIDSFSIFASALNSVSDADWPVFKVAPSLRFKPSGKSKLSKFESPALLLLRLRSLFGVGSRADLLAFFLAQDKSDYAISDTVEIGYSKRNLADMLEGFAKAGIFEVHLERNQQRYKFSKRNEFIKILSPIPKIMPSWPHLLEVILRLRDCIRMNEKKSADTKIIELRNTLSDMEGLLRRLYLIPSPLQVDFQAYWDSYTKWFLEELRAISRGVREF
jgi:hypothetical protein